MTKHTISYTRRSIGAILLSAWCSFSVAEEAELEFNYLPIGHVRTDPIINDSCLSDHVHTFYGPPLLSPSVTTEDLLESESSAHSGLVEENKSLYWHPSIYRVSSDGLFTLDEIYYFSVYYFWDTNEITEAFPKGFRMIASDREAFTECVVGDFKPCTRTDGCTIPEGATTFFPSQACDMLEITMDFPSCWDGRLDSDNHKDHMAYSDADDDSCTFPHDKQVPTVSVSIYIKNYDGGYHTWSDMSDQFHTDYLAGWDVELMETFLEGCKADVENCDKFLTWKSGGPTGCDSHDQKHDKLVNIMPPLPNTMEIANEAVTNIQNLPRGECMGPFSDDDGVPTTLPTPLPTDKPTLAPSESPLCIDDPSFRFQNRRKRNCPWVGRKPGARCNKTWEGKRLKDYCPESCDECELCRDDPTFRFKNDALKTCDWVSRAPTRRCGKLWLNQEIREFCPEACDECD